MNEEILKKGLTDREANELLQTHGLNELGEAVRFSVIRAFLSQFNNFLPLLLLLAAGISFFAKEFLDGVFIVVIVLLNGLLGTLQESKAERSLQYLKKITVTTVRVVRNGVEQIIDSRYLVPGDLVYIESGVKIPADIRLIKSWHLEINEAVLTGESLPVLKSEKEEQNNRALTGTVVVKGRAYGIVLNTGKNTRFGQIAQKLAEIKKQKTPLQNKLNLLSRDVGIAGLSASLLVFILSFIRDKNLFESFLFAVSLAVAAVPEGLPTVMTITLSLGIEKMAKKGAVIRKLSAIETLGTITVLATDKTGTLTTNNMSVHHVYIDDKLYDAHDLPKASPSLAQLLLNGIVCSTTSLVRQIPHSFDYIGDPTEGAILILAEKLGLEVEKIKNDWKITDEIAFDSKTKLMTVLAQNNQNHFIFTKGAPESIIPLCSNIMSHGVEKKLTEEKKRTIETTINSLANQGLRLIAFSYKTNHAHKINTDHIFLGMVAISDPIRPEIDHSVKKALSAGIKVIMITGDNELTAGKIGIEAGIIKRGEDVLTGAQIDSYSDEQLSEFLNKVKIFARTSPIHKYRLVKLLQKKGEIVAVTGDGINDALALKQADIGVAMGKTGTDVAKETADMVLTDDNFITLVNAVEEGRIIFKHIKQSVIYLLTTNCAEVLAVVFSALVGLPPILTALQILYINLITDGIPALSLAFSPKEKDIMKAKPRSNNHLLQQNDIKDILLIGITGSLITIASYLTGLYFGGKTYASTMAFTTLIFIQPFILADLWISKRWLYRHINELKKWPFIISIAIPLLLHPLILYTPFFSSLFHIQPITIVSLLLAFVYSMGVLVVLESRKVTFLSPH